MPEQRKKTLRQRPIDNNYGHLQPQAPDIEKIVLGALMIDKDAFTVVGEILHPETFYEPRHQKIYSAIQKLNIDERPVDILTVIEELKREGTLEECGGQTYIIDLSSHVASSAHIEYHAHILQQKYMARQLISYASVVETKAFDQKNLRQDYTQVEPVVKEAIQILQKASQNKGELTGIPTGYRKLDEMTAGWQSSDLIILAGRPAMGKTAFALSLAKNISVDYNTPVAFFSLEMNNVQLVNRLISNVCEIEGRKILNGQLEDEEWKRLDANVGKLQNAPIYVDDTAGMSIFELRTKARRLVREKGVKMIMIDYLQLMNANGAKFGSRQEEVSTISRSLKGLAKELNIPVLALSQLNRTVENREGLEGKRPQLSDLRESGAIEQDADMVLFVHRPEYYHILTDEHGHDLRGMAQIIIAKHRKGSTRFQNPDENDNSNRDLGGEIIGSKLNGGIDVPPPFMDGSIPPPLPDGAPF